MTKRLDFEDRRQQQLRRLGTQNPRCVICGEADPAVLELHHIAGRKFHDDQAIVCANCHRKLSDRQSDHVPPGCAEPEGLLVKIGHYLLGLADFLVKVVETLRAFGAWLIGQPTSSVSQ